LASPPGIRLAYQQLLESAAAIPGVQSAAITSVVPLSERDSEIPFWPGAGPQPPQDRMTLAMFYIVTPDYPSVMQIPLRRGRFFTDRDNLASPPVVVIDDVLAKRIFPGQDPIGRQISLIVVGPVQIAGVVGHVKHWGLDSDDTAKIRDQIYFPFMQVPDMFMSEAVAGLTLALRTGPEPLSLVPAVRAQVAGPTQDQPIYAVRTMKQIIAGSLAQRRFTMLLLIIFAATALLLAAVGIYGVMSYAVTRRSHEIGIRAALGASRGEIVGLVYAAGVDGNGWGPGCGPCAHAIHGRLAIRRPPGRPGDAGGGNVAAGRNCAAGVLHPRAAGGGRGCGGGAAVRVKMATPRLASGRRLGTHSREGFGPRVISQDDSKRHISGIWQPPPASSVVAELKIHAHPLPVGHGRLRRPGPAGGRDPRRPDARRRLDLARRVSRQDIHRQESRLVAGSIPL
jgi:hypothetical protein